MKSWWTVRNTSKNRWQPEEGWDTPEQAEKAAKFYRRTFSRRCVVVPTSDNYPTGDELAAVVWS